MLTLNVRKVDTPKSKWYWCQDELIVFLGYMDHRFMEDTDMENVDVKCVCKDQGMVFTDPVGSCMGDDTLLGEFADGTQCVQIPGGFGICGTTLWNAIVD